MVSGLQQAELLGIRLERDDQALVANRPSQHVRKLTAVCADVEDTVDVEVSEHAPEVPLEVETTDAPSPAKHHVESLVQNRERPANRRMEQKASSAEGGDPRRSRDFSAA